MSHGQFELTFLACKHSSSASAPEMVPEGAKGFFSQCEKRHFAPSGTISGNGQIRTFDPRRNRYPKFHKFYVRMFTTKHF